MNRARLIAPTCATLVLLAVPPLAWATPCPRASARPQPALPSLLRTVREAAPEHLVRGLGEAREAAHQALTGAVPQAWARARAAVRTGVATLVRPWVRAALPSARAEACAPSAGNQSLVAVPPAQLPSFYAALLDQQVRAGDDADVRLDLCALDAGAVTFSVRWG